MRKSAIGIKMRLPKMELTTYSWKIAKGEHTKKRCFPAGAVANDDQFSEKAKKG